MSEAAVFPSRPLHTADRGAGHQIVQLTLSRIREFTREPEAVFWTVLFPVLLTAGLGVAFRSQSGDVLKVVVSSPGDRRNTGSGFHARDRADGRIGRET